MLTPSLFARVDLVFALPVALALPEGGAAQVAAVLAGALVAAAAILAPTRWLLYGVIVAIPFDNYALPVGPVGLSVSDALLVVVAMRWLLGVLARGGRIARSELYAPAGLFFVLLLPSLAVTFDLAVSAHQAFSILMMLLTAVVATNLLRGESRLLGAVTAIVVASVVMSLLALLQLGVWMRYGVALWQVAHDYITLGGMSFLRLTGTYFDPNYLALYLIVPLIIGLFVATEGKVSTRYRVFLWLAMALDLAVFVMTFSRGGWVTLLVFMAAFVVLRARTRARALWATMLALVMVVAPIVALVLVGLNPRSVSNRMTTLMLALEVMAEHPLTGTGLGTFAHLPQNVDARVAHSAYLQIGADAGIPALIAFLILAIVIFANAVAALRAAEPGLRRTILTGCLWALACVGIQSAFLNALVLKQTWVLVGLTAAAVGVMGRVSRSADAPTTSRAGGLEVA